MQVSKQGNVKVTEAREIEENKVSIFLDGSVEAYEFVEGNRVCVEKDGTLKCVFLEEQL